MDFLVAVKRESREKDYSVTCIFFGKRPSSSKGVPKVGLPQSLVFVVVAVFLGGGSVHGKFRNRWVKSDKHFKLGSISFEGKNPTHGISRHQTIGSICVNMAVLVVQTKVDLGS